jgi:CP family cyanate transporter-like MFS transporter
MRIEETDKQSTFAQRTSRRASSHRLIVAIVALAIIFTAATLRSTITSMGALTLWVQDDLGLSSAAMGLVTTLPLLAFAASALMMNEISKRFGNSRSLAIGCAAIACGIIWRSYGSDIGLFGGTILLGIGISAGNVLLPAVVRERFPVHVGIMTALYTTTMSLFAGGAAGLASSLMGSLDDWRNILAGIAPFAAIGALLWLAVRFLGRATGDKRPKQTTTPKHTKLLSKHLVKSPITWWITGLFGVQSILFYGFVAWLPSILNAANISQDAITTCVALFPIVGIPCTLFCPPLAQRLRRQRMLGATIGALCALGVFALLFAHTDQAAIAAVTLLGFALGAPFCLCMFYFGVRTEDPDDASRLSSIAQTFGYLLAALGPACLGLLVDLSGSWSVALVIMFGLALLLIICGWKSGTGSIPAANATQRIQQRADDASRRP